MRKDNALVFRIYGTRYDIRKKNKKQKKKQQWDKETESQACWKIQLN